MSLPRINISDLNPKDVIESVYLVKYIAIMTAKDGKKYLNIILADGTGDLESRSWNNAEAIFDDVAKGSFIMAKGRVNLFQGRKQFIMQNYEKVSQDDVNMDEFVIKATEGPEKMYEDLLAIVDDLPDVYIKELLISILNDPEISRRLKLWQAGKTIHHAYQSGLLEHVLSCSRLAVSLSAHYDVNVSYVVAGAILHDLCKIYELTDGLNVEYTEEGKLIGHLVKSLEVVDRFASKIKDFPYQLKTHLKHILLSHHGEYAYGSPKIPQTSEAMLLHLIDLMDSKMHTFETIKRTDNQSGHWSGFVRHLDRIVFKDELPTYDEYVPREDQGRKPAPKPVEKSVEKSVPAVKKPEAKKPTPKKAEKDIKQNLGNLLKNFKVD